MKISFFGTGYVGLVSGVCFSQLKNNVLCIDIDKEKIEGLKKGILPIYEPGLEEMVLDNYKEGNLKFSTSVEDGVNNSDIIFIAVGTPQGENGKANLKYIYEVAKSIGDNLNSYKTVVTKSTVPVGTGNKIREIIQERLDKRGMKIEFGVVSNPEFLKEGEAIQDFFKPDRIVIGSNNKKSLEKMEELYSFLEDEKILKTDIKSAELIKYGANAMLATRISFMNEMSLLTEKIGGNIKDISKGMGLDSRIGKQFLNAGCGYGGSCFPKDVQALKATMEENGVEGKIIGAVEDVNKEQKGIIKDKALDFFKELKGKEISILGLSFKPNTDDIREATSLRVVEDLSKLGATLHLYDPISSGNFKSIYKESDKIKYFNEKYSAIKGTDLLIVLTEWDEFKNMDFSKISKIMKTKNIIDGRNILNEKELLINGFNSKFIGK